jgi:glyceraldehyde 3-phosphate dehydrogenase
MTKVAINGLGRIGRATFKILNELPEMDLVAINDLVPTDNLAYLLKWDSVYGKYQHEVEASDEGLKVGNKTFKVFNEKDPANLPWKKLEVDVVFECTGIFTSKEGMEKHIKAGAQKVILSAPAKEDDVPTIVFGVNNPEGDEALLSTASCTTNCIAPVAEVMSRRIGVKKAIMTTIHAYTSSQGIVDQPNKKMRRGRAAAVNFVPTSTGAAVATTKALPHLKGIFDGAAIRGPVPVGSIADITFVTNRPTSVDEVNSIFREEAGSERYSQVLSIAEDEIVSSDIIMNPYGSIFDPSMTQVVDGDLVKVMSWYDNEWGYASQMVRTAEYIMEMSAVRESR